MPGDQRVALKSVTPVFSPELASGRVRTSLRRDLTAALKAQDRVAIAALRSALAAIENAEAPAADQAGLATADSAHVAGSVVGLGAAEVPRRQLTESDLRAIVEAEVQQRLVAATMVCPFDNTGGGRGVVGGRLSKACRPTAMFRRNMPGRLRSDAVSNPS
jgi:uncharacterized protein